MEMTKFWLCQSCQQTFHLPQECRGMPLCNLNLTCPHCASSRTYYSTDAAAFLAAGGSAATVCAELEAEDAQGALPDLSIISLSELHNLLLSIQARKSTAIEAPNYRLANKLRGNEKMVLRELSIRRKTAGK